MYVMKIGDYYLKKYVEVYGDIKKAVITMDFEEAVIFDNSKKPLESFLEHGFKLYKLSVAEVKDDTNNK